jgi:hypothetical protein
LYRNNLSPNNRQRSSSNDFDAKYTEVLIDLENFRTLSGEDPKLSELSFVR